MSEGRRYPFLPEIYYWFVFESGGHRYRVGWPRLKIESLTPEAPGIADNVMAALDEAEEDNRAAARDFVAAMERQGFRFLGPSSFDFRSGTLYWQASTLLHSARTANERRESILAARNGSAPEPGDPEWGEWSDVTLEAGACVSGARVLGYASLEAFVNEVLYVNFRALYDAYEAKGAADRATPHASVPDKLARLLKELGISRKTDWYQCIRENAIIRRGIEHHKPQPAFTKPSSDLDSVAFEDGYGPDDVGAFLNAVQSAFQAIHDAFGVPVPPTHRSPYDEGRRGGESLES